MIYHGDFETRLGFDQIRHHLAGYCVGPSGRDHVRALTFLSDYPTITNLLHEGLEAKRILERGEDLPVRHYDDPRDWFGVIAVEGNFLEAVDFQKLRNGIRVIEDIKTFLKNNQDHAPGLFKNVPASEGGRTVLDAINKKIDDEGAVRDNASADLGRIRKRLREEEFKVRRVAEQIMRQVLAQGWTPEGSSPTIRDGRLVIPVTAEHKRKVKGYIIDQSSTGQTVFVEPGEVIEANNDLRELELEERKEIIRILQELTAFVRQHLPDLEKDYYFLGWMDFTRSKAKFAVELSAGLPAIVHLPALAWKEARHPLLYLSLRGKRPLIPLTISLTPEDHLLLISGPNAGGKSVALKTVGLVQYMFQCGLLVPMLEDSVMGIFNKIFLDIGDQQSIENDLSTYSSHLANMNYFIRNAAHDSLVLLDELGAGTDPNFGGGIAQAILEQLVEKKVWGLATTHYYNLKVFAGQRKGLRNAAMLFDAESLSPLYRMEAGQPGSSFALEIARKTGLPKETLAEAERIIGSDLTGLETLMKQMADEKKVILEKSAAVREHESKLLEARQRYEELAGKLEGQKKDILNSAKTEASNLLQETNREIEKTIRHIRENRAEKQETRKVRKDLGELSKKVKPSAAPVKYSVPLKTGDKVRIMGGEVTGTILAIKGKSATVQFGELRSVVALDRLVRSDLIAGGIAKPAVRGVELHQRQSAFSPVLDLRGKRVEEVQQVLERFIDDAVLLGQAEVKILHGKGEGVLRKVVRDYLKKLKSVADFQDEHVERGGDGITVVRMK